MNGWLPSLLCSEFSSIFNISGKYDIISGYLDDEKAWEEINEWLVAVSIATGMKNNRLVYWVIVMRYG